MPRVILEDDDWDNRAYRDPNSDILTQIWDDPDECYEEYDGEEV